MGDPRRIKKKYNKPKHPWRADRIEMERSLIKKYGLKNKKEIWRAETLLRGFRRQAKLLLAKDTEQSKKEEKQLLDRLRRMNLLGKDSVLEDVLALKLENIFERRLQTIVHKKNLASTPKQARQFVVHGHIYVAGGRVTVPSYIVQSDEENKITSSAPKIKAKEK